MIYLSKKNRMFEGQTVKVLVDGKSRKNSDNYSGRTDKFKLVNFESDTDVTGQLIDVEITECKSFSLDGKAVL